MREAETAPIGEEAARRTLDRVLGEEHFRRAPALTAFLRYCANETLAGRGDRLKAYAIATEALGRAADFDPGTDPAVRVLAGRVRKALELDAARQPPGTPIIVLEAGSYRPLWLRAGSVAPDLTGQGSAAGDWTAGGVAREAPVPGSDTSPAGALERTAPPPRRGRRRGLVAAMAIGTVLVAGALAGWHIWSRVLPPDAIAPPDWSPHTAALAPIRTVLSVTAVSAEAEPIAEAVENALARFDDLVIVRVADGASVLDQAYRLTIAVEPRPPSSRVLMARLLRQRDATLVWSLERPIGPDEADRMGLARAIATALAQPYGVIFADRRAGAVARDADAEAGYQCLVTALDYWRLLERAQRRRALTCLEELVRLRPHFAPGHANLAIAQVEAYRQFDVADPAATLAAALGHAETAVALAPLSARARQALVTVLFAQGAVERGLAEARRAVEHNPADMEILADLGARLVQAGRCAEARAPLEEARRHMLVVPPWHHFFLFLAAHCEGRREDSLRWLAELPRDRQFGSLIAHVLMAHQRGDTAGASAAREVLARTYPALFADPRAYLDRRGFAPVLRDRLVRDLADAGIPPTRVN
jgi:tetratricopeptide (TPR) repeat protein